MIIETLEQHEQLVQSLMSPDRWPDGGGDRQRIDTHISTVVLAGDLAYKIKKPLDLGFLNFLALDDRQHACEEEVRINRRLAPAIYDAACRVTGSADAPAIDGDGQVIDWCVRMHRFDPESVLSNPDIPLPPSRIDDLGRQLGEFHDTVARADPGGAFGDVDAVAWPMRQNFAQVREHWPDAAARLQALAEWTESRLSQLHDTLRERHLSGCIRECHGDLHLGNVALIDGRPVIFDAIEFNDSLRWIDTANDVAFLTMDLHHRGHAALAWRLLDVYLQQTGDYAMLRLLVLYEVYRALVRAKIAAIRRGQLAGAERDAVESEFDSYVALAERLSAVGGGALVITHGLSGSGKSRVAASIVDRFPAVRLRSDVERKRMLGLAGTSDATALGGYTQAMTASTYERLAGLAELVMASGLVAVVDATFLRREQRDHFRRLAESAGVPFVIVDCRAPIEVLRQRIEKRASHADNVSDAGLEVLEAQLGNVEPVTDDESADALRVTPESPLDFDRLGEMIGRQPSLPA